LVSGVTVNNSFGTEVYQEKWYAFEAIEGGEYNFIFNQDNNLKMEIIDRDGMTSSFESYTWQNPWDYNWNAYAGGRYYVKVSPEWWYPDLAVNYSLTMTTNASTYQSDFASIEGPGVPDEKVDFIDFVFLSDYWLQECSEPYWCEKTDINKDGTVDILDLVQFVEQWLYEK
jgi:hypothetical protein